MGTLNIKAKLQIWNERNNLFVVKFWYQKKKYYFEACKPVA